MKGKLILLILGFVLGLFASSFIYLFRNFQQKTQPVSNNFSAQPNSNIPSSKNSFMIQYSDIQFLNLMIVNHQEAVQMAQRAIVGSTNDFIKNLSESIISTQSKEINNMKIEIDKIVNQNK